MKKTTLEQQGSNLCIGLVDPKNPAKRHRSFSFRPYKGKTDRLLNDWYEQNKTSHKEAQLLVGKVAKHLSLVVERIGDMAFPVDKDGDSTPETLLAIMSLPIPDVLQMYTYLRLQTLGSDFHSAVKCKSCGHEEIKVYDLRSAELKVAESEVEISFWYDLQDPIPSVLDQGREIRSIKIRPAPFATLMSSNFNSKTSTLDSLLLQESVTSINEKEKGGRPYRLQQQEIDEMSKRDLTAISVAYEDLSGGLNLAVIAPCSKCQSPVIDLLNWTYESFFEQSPLLATKKL